MDKGLDLIDQQLEAASAPLPPRRKPLLFFFKDGRKTVVRPLVSLKDAIVLKVHKKWFENPDDRVDAVCAWELGQECLLCKDKKLASKIYWYLPVYLHQAFDTKNDKGEPIEPFRLTWKRKDDNGTEVMEYLKGTRVLELSAYDRTSAILKWFREFMQDSENPSITELDFNISQSGSGQKKDFPVSPKVAKVLPPEAEQERMSLNLAEIRARIIESKSPVEAGKPSAKVAPSSFDAMALDPEDLEETPF